MYKEQQQQKAQNLIRFCALLATLIVVFSCKDVYKGRFEVVKYHESNNKWPCYIKIENKKYLVIENKRRYEDGKLIEYEGCASEGKYIKNFEKINHYSFEDFLFKNLSIQRTKKEVMFFDKTYPITKENKDSVFVSTKIKDEFYVFIGKIPLIK